MELESRDDAKIVFEGDGVTGAFVGPATYIEEFEP
jgi:hypothetical protein